MFSKLKYIYILFALTLCMLSACDSDEQYTDVSTEVSFDVSGLSRATVTTGFDEFAIYGDMKRTNTPIVVFDNTKVMWDNGWRYEGGTQYWFPQYEHSFIGVQPAIPDAEYSDSRLSFAYTVPDDYTAASDLMVATHRRKYYENSRVLPVVLKFQHILSRIDFKLKNDKAADYVKVTEIKLIGVNKTGSFSIIPAPLSSGSVQTDDYIPLWTGISNKGTLTANINVNIPENETWSLFPDDNALFMIPQPDNNDVIMEITYEQWDDGAKFEEHTLTASTPIGGWVCGKMYTYTMTVCETSQDTYLTVSVKNWQGLNNSSGITVPEN